AMRRLPNELLTGLFRQRSSPTSWPMIRRLCMGYPTLFTTWMIATTLGGSLPGRIMSQREEMPLMTSNGKPDQTLTMDCRFTGIYLVLHVEWSAQENGVLTSLVPRSGTARTGRSLFGNMRYRI